MNAAIDDFIDKIKADPSTARHAQALADALAAVDLEGDGSPEAAGFMAVVAAVCRTKGSVLNRLRLLAELAEFEGKVSVPRALLEMA